MYVDRSLSAARLISLPFRSDTASMKSNGMAHCRSLRMNRSSCSWLELSAAQKQQHERIKKAISQSICSTYLSAAAKAAARRLVNYDSATNPATFCSSSSTIAWQTDRCGPQTFRTTWCPIECVCVWVCVVLLSVGCISSRVHPLPTCDLNIESDLFVFCAQYVNWIYSLHNT